MTSPFDIRTAYPRDLVGYGRQPPDPKWPGAARIAVQFVINYEEGGENCILNGDAASEAFLSEIIGAQPWPNQRHMSMESIYEYGSRVGFWRLYRLFTSRDMPVTVFAIATALARNREAVTAMKEARWEIATHGLKWIDYRDFTEEAERTHVEQAIRIHTDVVGQRPMGFYQGRTSVHSLAIAMKEQGFLYCADSYADELPYWVEANSGPQLIVPYTLDANDMRFATNQGFNSGDQFYTYLKDSFDTLYAEGASGHPRMMSVGIHCRLAGRPGRAAALARFLDYVKSHDHVWVATRLEIARHWVRHHLPDGLRPSRMHRALFVEQFGEIFEHTPQIAERTHAAGLDKSHDTPEGLHKAMVAVMLAMSRDEKLALIRLHPELAGKLAVEGQLTADSTSEQGRLGFTSMSREEIDKVADINRRYREKHGFPAIVALALHQSRSTVIAEMEARIANSTDAEIAAALDQIGHITKSRVVKRMQHA